MIGPEYNWLVTPERTAAGTTRIRLARGSLRTVAFATFCLGCTLLSTAPALTAPSAPTVALQAEALSLDKTSTDWPRTFLHIWFLLPQLVPHDH